MTPLLRGRASTLPWAPQALPQSSGRSVPPDTLTLNGRCSALWLRVTAPRRPLNERLATTTKGGGL